MSIEDHVEAVVAIVDSWGGVDVMFNNAGIMHDDVGYPSLTIRMK